MSMHIGSTRASRVAMLVALSTLFWAPAARGATPASGTVTPSAPFSWAGPVASGQNQDYDAGTGEPCGQAPADFCDRVLVRVDPGNFFDTNGGGVEFSTSGAAAGSDMDLFVYRSDATGARGLL